MTKSASTTTKPEGLARALRIARAARGMKSYEVEEQAGVRRGYLSQLENGSRRPRPDTLRRIEAALGVSSTTLLMLSVDQEERDKMGDATVEILARQAMRELLRWP